MKQKISNRQEAILAGFSGNHKLAKSLFNDEDAKVRSAALSSLEKLGKLSKEILNKAICDTSSEVRKRGIEIIAKRDEPLPLKTLEDEDPLVLETACWAAGEKEKPSSELIRKLCSIAKSHEDQLCRESAVAALGSIGSPSGLETVLSALKDKPAIRRRAAIALAAFDDPKVDDALKESLNDRDWQVRQIAEDLLDANRVISSVEIGPRPN
ncbi:MAG: HEAT repeat domain-containing protein [Actinomycetota bacterium]|nr:HEAT repeat domain-containing protein [Actinomycetota bacterium]